MKRQTKLALAIILIAVAISGGMLTYSIYKANSISNASSKINMPSLYDKTKSCNVLFYDEIGKKLKGETVKFGEFVKPPKKYIPPEGFVFLGWDKDILNITGNTEIHPVNKKIDETENAIYANALYVKSGNTFKLDLLLDGSVNASELVLTISYDSSMLQCKGKKSIDKDIVLESDSEAHLINITLNSEKNILKKTKLASLSFKAIGKQYSYTEVILKAKSISVNLQGEKKRTDCTVYNGKIYIY